MALTEKRVLKSVEILPSSGTAQVAWADLIIRDDDEENPVSEGVHRRAYTVDDREAFMAEVEGAENYVAALGWAA